MSLALWLLLSAASADMITPRPPVRMTPEERAEALAPPPPEPSRMPWIVAGAGGVVLVGAALARARAR